MKNSLIKKIAVSGAVVIGMFAFGGGTSASASASILATPYTGHFTSRTVTYHINSSSKHWQKVWTKAIHKLNKNGTVKLKATSKKKAKMTLTTVAKLKGNNPWDVSWNGKEKNGLYIFRHASLKLNRKVCVKKAYFEKSNKAVDGKTMETINAMDAIAVGLGLDQNTAGNDSFVNEFGWWHSNLTKADKLGLAKAYANVK